jgi:hypothetical protein
MDRQAVAFTVAFVAAGIFGLVLLIGGDWLPGGIIVAAALAGLVVQIWRLNRRDEAESGLPPHSGTK